jgi:hypothetical protein
MKEEIQLLIQKLYAMIGICDNERAKEAYRYSITELKEILQNHGNPAS